MGGVGWGGNMEKGQESERVRHGERGEGAGQEHAAELKCRASRPLVAAIKRKK